jgi:hypothetical protein
MAKRTAAPGMLLFFLNIFYLLIADILESLQPDRENSPWLRKPYAYLRTQHPLSPIFPERRIEFVYEWPASVSEGSRGQFGDRSRGPDT